MLQEVNNLNQLPKFVAILRISAFWDQVLFALHIVVMQIEMEAVAILQYATTRIQFEFG